MAVELTDFKKLEYKATRAGYGDGVLELGAKNKDVVVLSADLSPSLKILPFREKFPKRYFELGVAESDMAGVAAGLAFSGKIPFMSTFAVFATGRCFDQLRVSVAYANANVKIAGSHAGVHTGEDGASHQALEDVALMRVLPNFTVVVPCDYNEAKKATIQSAAVNGPVYLRLFRNKFPVITKSESDFKIGKASVFREGKDATIVASGLMVYHSLLAAESLKKQKIDVRVINLHTIKPIDKDAILKAAKETGRIVTAEDHQIGGGMGSAVAELLAENYPVPMRFVGVRDRFGQSGKPDDLLKEYGLTAGDIEKAVVKVIKKN
ncbi:transketolase family protein [Candidatus Woesearchaeota archaeon]|nr:transketolase family protein [Candidatus Woesearchaeota archaeon]